MTGNTYTITGLTGGIEYAIRAIATNGVGDGPASAEATETPAGGVSQQNTEPENNAPTGLPTISGTVQVDQTLTTGMSGIRDEDGLTNVSYSYQWIRGGGSTDTDIQDATSSTYILVTADQGKTIKVRVSFTDDANNQETLTSAATAAVDAKPNSPAAGAPTIGGRAQVGQTLTASISGISDADGMERASFGYRWLRVDGETETLIEEASGASYTLSNDDLGKTIKVLVSFTDDANNIETLDSEPTATVGSKPNSPATGEPTISGTARVDETLTASTSGIADADGLSNVSYSYQWIRNDGNADSEIPGATGSTYELVDADNGKTVKVKVSFTDEANNQESLTSQLTATVAPRPPLTASFLGTPATHDSQTAFTFELRFSENFPLSYKTLKFHAFTVTGGKVTKSKRLEKPSNVRWEIHVQPNGNGSVTIVLPITTDCDAQGAICTPDGRKLSNRNELTVSGPSG